MPTARGPLRRAARSLRRDRRRSPAYPDVRFDRGLWPAEADRDPALARSAGLEEGAEGQDVDRDRLMEDRHALLVGQDAGLARDGHREVIGRPDRDRGRQVDLDLLA